MTTALLIIDVQHALCSGEEAAFDIGNVIERINMLSARARAAKILVILVQHEEADGALTFGSEGWQLASGLVVSPSDLRVRKRTPNSFHGTGLDRVLRDRGIGRLVVSGLQTDFCVDTTVRQALPLGYSVVLVSDGHSTIDNGTLSAAQIIAHHNATLRSMNSFGPPISVTPADGVSLSA